MGSLGVKRVSFRQGHEWWCQSWVGERTGVLAGRKDSYLVIRCLLLSLLIPFRVSWDRKHQQIVCLLEVNSYSLTLLWKGLIYPKLACPLLLHPATAEPLILLHLWMEVGDTHHPGVCLPLVWPTLAPPPSWLLEAGGGTRVRETLSWEPMPWLSIIRSENYRIIGSQGWKRPWRKYLAQPSA